MPCLFFLNKASTCGEDHKRYFSNQFSPLIYVLLVQIWITRIKCKKWQSLEYIKWTSKNTKLARQWFHRVCWSYKKYHVQTKKIPQLSLKIKAVLSRNHESSSDMARFVKTQHGNGLQTISNFDQYIMKSVHGTMPNLNYFWLIFRCRYFQKRKSPFFRGSFAIFKWFTAFSLHLMQVIQIRTTSTQIIIQKWLQNLSYGLLHMLMPYARKIGRATCENIIWNHEKMEVFIFENNENGK